MASVGLASGAGPRPPAAVPPWWGCYDRPVSQCAFEVGPRDTHGFVQVGPLARFLGLHPETIRVYLRRGRLRGVQIQKGPRAGLDPPRRTVRGRWLVERASVEEMFTDLYGGGPVPPGLFRYLRRRAAEPAGPGSFVSRIPANRPPIPATDCESTAGPSGVRG